MILITTVIWLVGLVSLCSAAYCSKDDYFAAGTNFFDNFDFFTLDDYTHGYVNYVDKPTAASLGLINTNNGAYMGVDSTNVASGRGRNSVRITSKRSYQYGLFILDLAHMPGGACGEWPAFWTVGPNWPNSGEIDIIEGVNSQTTNTFAMHTTSGCSISQGSMSGTVVYPNCDINAPNQPGNSGCVISTSSTSTYGAGFNAAGGGVVAMEWSSGGAKIYIFNRNNIPADITAGKPQTPRWGNPIARFALPCNMTNYLFNQQIVFDITFCGDWAGAVWSSDSTCAPKASSCQSYVQNNPSAFSNSYWAINSLKVYTDDGRSPLATCPSTTTQAKRAMVLPTDWTPNYAKPANILAQSQSGNQGNQQWGPPVANQKAGQGKQYSKIQGNPVPRDAMPILEEDDLFSPHEHLEDREAMPFAEPDPVAEPEPEPEPVPIPVAEPNAQPEPEAEPEPELVPESEPEANITLEEEDLNDETFEKRQGPYVGPNGIVQAGQNRPINGRPSSATPGPAAFRSATKITVTVTSTVYSGRSTSTRSNPVNPTTMKTTSTPPPPAASTPKANANVNLMQANAFGSGRGGQGQGQQQQGARNAARAAAPEGPKPKVKKPRAWYENRDETSEADVNLLTTDTANDTPPEPDLELETSGETLQERLYILPDELDEFVGGGAHHYHGDEMTDEDADWELLFGSGSRSGGGDHDHDHDHDHDYDYDHDMSRKLDTHLAIPGNQRVRQHAHQHAHHQHSHSHSHSHSHPHPQHHHHPDHDHDHHDARHPNTDGRDSNDQDLDHENHDEEHYYNGQDLSSLPEMTPQRMLKEMQRRRAEEKKAAQLRKELAEIELRRVKEMLGRRGRHAAGGGVRGKKGWW